MNSDRKSNDSTVVVLFEHGSGHCLVVFKRSILLQFTMVCQHFVVAEDPVPRLSGAKGEIFLWRETASSKPANPLILNPSDFVKV